MPNNVSFSFSNAEATQNSEEIRRKQQENAKNALEEKQRLSIFNFTGIDSNATGFEYATQVVASPVVTTLNITGGILGAVTKPIFGVLNSILSPLSGALNANGTKGAGSKGTTTTGGNSVQQGTPTAGGGSVNPEIGAANPFTTSGISAGAPKAEKPEEAKTASSNVVKYNTGVDTGDAENYSEDVRLVAEEADELNTIITKSGDDIVASGYDAEKKTTYNRSSEATKLGAEISVLEGKISFLKERAGKLESDIAAQKKNGNEADDYKTLETELGKINKQIEDLTKDLKTKKSKQAAEAEAKAKADKEKEAVNSYVAAQVANFKLSYAEGQLKTTKDDLGTAVEKFTKNNTETIDGTVVLKKGVNLAALKVSSQRTRVQIEAEEKKASEARDKKEKEDERQQVIDATRNLLQA